jgi:shikimate kinase
MPKSGKTTIGKKLARTLGWNFIDTDQMIIKAHGRACRDLFLQQGETNFREMESQQVVSLKNIQNTVISIGGGALCNPENASHLQSLGKLVYLKVPSNILWSRNSINGMPAFISSHDAFKKLEEKRLPIYERYATTHIEVYKLTIKEVINAILDTK